MNPTSTAQPIVILISGRGTNMRALIECSRDPAMNCSVRRVLSDRPDAGGLMIADELGVDNRVVAPVKGVDRTAYDRLLMTAIDETSPALIVLAGFMRILSKDFVDRYAGRILNIHPSLLPLYPGLHTHRRALAAQDVEHGATVHFVTEQLDGGPRVIQGRVAVDPQDDETRLAARVMTQELRIYPRAVRWFCQGRLRCAAGQAWLDGKPLPSPVQVDETTACCSH